MINKNSSKAICFLLTLFILFPKVLLIHYTSSVLWAAFNYTQLLYIFMQDTMLAIIYYGLLSWAYKKNKQSLLFFIFFISIFLLTFLMLDVRVRELWLRPINFDLISYTFNNYKDLMSGSEVFLNYYAGLGMTFRRALFVVIFLFTFLFLILLRVQKVEFKLTNQPHASKSKAYIGVASAVIFSMLFAFSVTSKSLIYSTEENVLISSLIKPFTYDISSANKQDAIFFEQPLRQLDNHTSNTTGTDSSKVFKNVIIIILESVRFKEFGLMNESDLAFHMPFLKNLASEGLIQKCYVSVPHTSKSQFAILSGRNPFPNIEMRESLIGNVPSIISLLKEVKGSSSHFITVQNLSFENTSGMIKALGFEHIYGPDDFSKNNQVITSSSFGLTDDTLLNYPFDQVKQKEPFILTFMTNGAHYPYNYPDKSPQAGISYKEYLKAEEFTDQSVARLFGQLDKSDLLNDTLVVIVGDHGESFGEHGTYIHNSSMYEEEVTVPLIFWAKDKEKLKDVQMRQPARQIDIAPTIADLFGIGRNKNYVLQGRSLIINADQSEADYPVFISTFFANVSQAIVYKGEKLILNAKNGSITKFNLESDLAELNGNNVVGKEYEDNMIRFEQFSNYHEHVFTKSE